MSERTRRWFALAVLTASGFAGLGYQIVWTEQAALWLGHESAAVLAVVAAFFGGLSIGALWLAPAIERSARPERWYAACETVIGGWSLALAWLLAPATEAMLGLIGARPSAVEHWLLAFSGTFVLLLPATAAMGATLPALERVFRGAEWRGGIAALYAGNTFGALLGVLGSTFVLVPSLGLAGTAAVCAALNLLCALAALWIFPSPAAGAALADATTATRDRKLPWLLAATGFLGIGYEVLVVRVVSQVAEDTVFTFAILLAAYLAGTALGAAGYARVSRAARDTRPSADGLFVALAAACLLGTLCLAGAGRLKTWALALLPPSLSSALMAEALLACVGFLVPTVIMGAIFSHLATRARASGLGFGRALGLNTLGAAAAPALFGVLLVPALGTKLALLLVAAAYLLLGEWRIWRRPPAWAAAAGVVVLALTLGPLTFIDVPDGGRVVAYREGVLGTVSVVEDGAGVATLHINNRQQEGSSATRYADSRQALLPLLLHPAPQRVLFLGLGTGVTAEAAADEPGLTVAAVELLPEVVAASAYFTDRGNQGGSRDEHTDRRFEIVTADARRFVRAATQSYDVIVADNFHPARSGSAALYTVEHFAAVRERLNREGVFCQWLPLHQLDLTTLRSIVRTFVAVYPHARALLATYSLETPVLGLIGSADAHGLDIDRVRARLEAANAARQRTSPATLGIGDDLALLGTLIAGPQALARFAGDAPLNTDDRPLVSYLAPRQTYAPTLKPSDRLLALIDELSIQPGDVLSPPGDRAFDARLTAYWAARDHFLAAGRDVKLSGSVEAMLSQVRGPLLDTLKISPEFRPAYDPLLQMALALGSANPEGARSLLLELEVAQPARGEAARALLGLDRH